MSKHGCVACPAQNNLRKFGNDWFCERCAGDGVRICRECCTTNEDDMLAAPEGPDFCQQCRSVDSFECMEWEEGTP